LPLQGWIAGWINGQTIAIETRWGLDTSDPLPLLVDDLARQRPDLIVAAGTSASQAAQRTVREFPIVFLMGSDPVASGIVKSLARPGENVTGFSNFLPATTRKMLELIKIAVPSASRIGRVYDPGNHGKLLECRSYRRVHLSSA
jgi:putative ABC transport system substrate-binding protein